MNYEIKETHLVFENENLKEVAVLWADKDSLRATYGTSKLMDGYVSFSEKEPITNELFQRVAGAGIYLDDDRKKKYFPNVKNWSR